MVIAQVQDSAWVFRMPPDSGLIHEDTMATNPNRVMICLAEALPPVLTGTIVWLRGGPVDVAILTASGVAFASVAAVTAIQPVLVKLAEVYQARRIEIESGDTRN